MMLTEPSLLHRVDTRRIVRYSFLACMLQQQLVYIHFNESKSLSLRFLWSFNGTSVCSGQMSLS